MNLETPKKFRGLANQAHQVAANYFRPISRKYDKAVSKGVLHKNNAANKKSGFAKRVASMA